MKFHAFEIVKNVTIDTKEWMKSKVLAEARAKKEESPEDSFYESPIFLSAPVPPVPVVADVQVELFALIKSGYTPAK